MKDMFRVRFSERGWVVQHTRIGLIWTDIGETVYKIKDDAKKVVDGLASGVAPDEWFKKVDK